MASALLSKKHVLVCLEKHIRDIPNKYDHEVEYILKNFLGTVMKNPKKKLDLTETFNVYLCGDIILNLK